MKELRGEIKEILERNLILVAHAPIPVVYGLQGLDSATEEISKLIPQWIPVSERLPEIPEGKHWVTCLVCQEGHVYIADYIGLLGDKPRWEDCGSAGMYGVTHWQYLPELPKEAKNA